ncbi:hypothetical protein [Methanoregula formicica]|uniref:hypothetical protein n=1 Tax=Methanoregula formicica TaxID=882104 RepID=UPI0011D19438|nr:hypothetical protein [Methanoregula formicica]
MKESEKIQPGERKDVIPWFLPGSVDIETITVIPILAFFHGLQYTDLKIRSIRGHSDNPAPFLPLKTLKYCLSVG